MENLGGAICVFMVCLIVVSALDAWMSSRPP